MRQRVVIGRDEITHEIAPVHRAQLARTRASILAQAREEHSGALTSFSPELIQESTKASVYALRQEGMTTALVAKIHDDADAFAQEFFALRLLGDRDRIAPRLVLADEPRGILFLEFVPDVFIASDVEAFCRLASALGRLHRAFSSSLTTVREHLVGCSLGERLEDLAAEDFVDRRAAKEALTRLAEDAGPEHIPVFVGDWKPGHARLRDDGSVAFIDFETFAPGLPELLDVLGMLNLTSDHLELDRDAWCSALQSYLLARDGRSSSIDRHYETLLLLARAVGFDGLPA